MQGLLQDQLCQGRADSVRRRGLEERKPRSRQEGGKEGAGGIHCSRRERTSGAQGKQQFIIRQGESRRLNPWRPGLGPYPASPARAASRGPALHSAWPGPGLRPGGCTATPGARDQPEPGSAGPALADPQLCTGFALALWLPGQPASPAPAESRKRNSWTEAEVAAALGGPGMGRLWGFLQNLPPLSYWGSSSPPPEVKAGEAGQGQKHSLAHGTPLSSPSAAAVEGAVFRFGWKTALAVLEPEAAARQVETEDWRSRWTRAL